MTYSPMAIAAALDLGVVLAEVQRLQPDRVELG
jgi:hypothetical protein